MGISDLFGGESASGSSGDSASGSSGDSASDSIKKAQQEYMEYLNKALAELQQSREQGRTDITGYAQPYIEAGQQGLDAYLSSLGLKGGAGQQTSADRFRMTPGYQFMMQQGTDALNSAGAARGMTGSGAQARALQRYGQGLASQQYAAHQARLAGLAGMGQQTSMQTGQELSSLGLNYSGDIANLYGTMGRTSAESSMASARAASAEKSGLWGSIGTVAGSVIGAYFGGPAGAVIGGKAGGSLGKTVSGGQGWDASGGQQPQQQGGGLMSMFSGQGGAGAQVQGGAPGGFGSLFGQNFGQNYSPSQGTAASNMWGSNVWENPDTGQLVPIY